MAAAVIAGLLLASGAADSVADADPEVKKSESGVCHGQDSVHYQRTKKFTPYDSMEACLASGGRESRAARKTSPWRWAVAAVTLIVLAVLCWLWMRRKPGSHGGPGGRLDELEQRRWAGHRRR